MVPSLLSDVAVDKNSCGGSDRLRHAGCPCGAALVLLGVIAKRRIRRLLLPRGSQQGTRAGDLSGLVTPLLAEAPPVSEPILRSLRNGGS